MKKSTVKIRTSPARTQKNMFLSKTTSLGFLKYRMRNLGRPAKIPMRIDGERNKKRYNNISPNPPLCARIKCGHITKVETGMVQSYKMMGFFDLFGEF
jgi:hypothetical protein